MESLTTTTSDNRRRSRWALARDVLGIVLIGVALGVAFNAVELASRPPRGVLWVPAAQRLDDVDSLLRLAEVTAVSEATARLERSPSLPGPAASAKAAPPAGRPSMAATTPPPTAAARATAAGAPERTLASDAETDRSASEQESRRALPVIPDVDRALRVELPLVSLLVEAGAALVVDARDAQEFADGHIPAAINIPYDQAMANPARLEKLDAGGRPIIVYCSGGTCESSRYLAELLMREFKKKRVLVYEGGFPEWAAAGKPVVKGSE